MILWIKKSISKYISKMLSASHQIIIYFLFSKFKSYQKFKNRKHIQQNSWKKQIGVSPVE